MAGGIASGETVFEALIREGFEEASFKRSIFNNVVQAGTINYFWRNKKFSLRRDTLFLFDLELSNNIIFLKIMMEKFQSLICIVVIKLLIKLSIQMILKKTVH